MLNHIENAVGHLKAEAQQRAEQYAREIIAQVVEALAHYTLDECAPAPRAWQAPTVTVLQYKAAQRKRDLYKGLRSEAGQAKFVLDARANAAAQYDAFVAKLNAKIGPVTSAKLTGNHVWDFSNLEVVTEAGETQVWRTQTIINVSKLGKVFNQFPTRQIKAGK